MIPFNDAKKIYSDAFGSDFDKDRGDFLKCLYYTCLDLPKPCRVLEIGTYQGKSAFVMACALHGTASNLICIDPIFIDGRIVCADAHHGWAGYDSKVRDVLCRLSEYRIAQSVSIIAGFSECVFDHWDGRTFDMVLVDGGHTATQVALDARWTKYMKPMSIILFDDWVEEVEIAVEAYFKGKTEWKLLHKSTTPATKEWAITAFQRID